MDETDPAATPDDYPFEDVVSRWDLVIEEMGTTAADHEAEGYETVQLHPGDVNVSAGEKPNANPGIDVLVPGEEFERLRDAVENRAFDSYEVFRTTDNGIVFLLVVLTDAAEEVAVFVPAYYDEADTDELQIAVRGDDGTLTTHVRPLEHGERVEFDHENPEPFFPEGYGSVV